MFYGLLITNGFAHVMPMLLGRGYNPGALTAAVLFIPLFFWMAHTCFGPARTPGRGRTVIVVAGTVAHGILMGSLLAFLRSVIGVEALIIFQVLNAILFLSIPWIAERGSAGKSSAARVAIR